MKFFKSSSAEDAGADNSSEDGVASCTTTFDYDVNDEVDSLLDTPPIRCQMMMMMMMVILVK